MPPDSAAPAVTISPPLASATTGRARPDMRLLSLLALGHMVVDINLFLPEPRTR
jgi:hypothetical protein